MVDSMCIFLNSLIWSIVLAVAVSGGSIVRSGLSAGSPVNTVTGALLHEKGALGMIKNALYYPHHLRPFFLFHAEF